MAFLCATGVLYLHLYYWRRVYREGGAKGQNLYFFANNIIHDPLDVPRSYIYIYIRLWNCTGEFNKEMKAVHLLLCITKNKTTKPNLHTILIKCTDSGVEEELQQCRLENNKRIHFRKTTKTVDFFRYSLQFLFNF